jgi:putative exosortase-associated protein (TIGR04073 family)
MGRMRIVFALAVLSMLALPADSRAAQTPDEGSAPRKYGRGLAAMTCGFLEVPGSIVQEQREHGPARGYTLGLAKGLGRFVVRELVGVYEFVTAPLDWPEGYQAIIEPEFPWDYFEE